MEGLFGLLAAAVGSGLTLLSQHFIRRDQRKISSQAREDAERVRGDELRERLWERSLDAAQRLQGAFLKVLSSARAGTPWEEDEWDDDRFDESWASRVDKLEVDVAAIPNVELRDALRQVLEATSAAWGLWSKVGIESNQRKVVVLVATLGFDLTSEWLRGEQTMSPMTAARSEELAADLKEMYEMFEAEQQAEEAHSAKKAAEEKAD